jgi:hypothetical protein
MSLDQRTWVLRRGLVALIPFLAMGAAGVRGQAPAQQYEVEIRRLVDHQLVNKDATPVPVDAAAAAHAAMIASPKIAERAIDKFRLSELQSLKNIPRGEVAQAISRSFTVVGKASDEVDSVSILSVRFRSTSVNDAMTIVRAMRVAYDDYLGVKEKDIGTRLMRAEQEFDRLTRQCETLRRLGPASALPEAERLLKETSSELPMLRLKHRVQSFDVVDEFVKASNVGSP